MKKLYQAQLIAKKASLLLISANIVATSLLLNVTNPQKVEAICGANSSSSSISGVGSARVGGIALDQAAAFLADMSDITAAYYDNSLDRVVFIGKSEVLAPKFNKDDLAIAIRAVAFKDTVPMVSIEPTPQGSMQDVLYYGGIEDTHFGKVLFDADFKLKKYLHGYDENGQAIGSSVPGFKSQFQRWLEKNPSPAYTNSSRWWIRPELISLKKDDSARAFVFDQTKMQVLTEPLSASNDPKWNQAAEEFAQHQSANYDQFATETPEYAEAKRLAKIVSVVKWIKDQGITTDFEWARNYTPETVQTPRTLAQIHTPVVQQGGYSYSMYGGVEYQTPNSYQADSGTSTALKTASQAQSHAKEDLHWAFTKDAQDYKAVAVAADAFRTLGAYTTAATDFSSQASPDMNLELTRTYSSFDGSQKGIGRGWDMIPATLTDLKPGQITSCNGGSTWTDFPLQLAFQANNGHYETFTYDCNSQSYKPSEAYGHSELTRDGSIFYVKLKDQRTYAFGSSYINGMYKNLNLQSISDKNNETISYEFDQQNGTNILKKIKRWATVAEPKHELTLSYGTNGNVSSVQDWTGRTAQYAYDNKGNLLTVTDPRGGTTQYTYDSNNKLATIKDRTGQTVLANTYTPEAKVSTQNDANNNSTTFNYNNDTRIITATDSSSRISKVAYDDRGRITKEIDPLLQNIEYTWGVDQYIPSQIKDKLGNITANNVDSATGDLLSTTFPDKKTISYEYDNKHRLTKIIDPRYGSTPKVTTYSYDNANNVVSKNEAGRITTYEYVVTFQTTGRLKSETDSLGHKTEWTTSGYGKRLTEKNHLNQTTSFEYDLGNRLAKQTDPAGKIQTYTYDPNDNLLTVTNAAGTTTNLYNQENRLTKTTAPDNTITEFAYSPSGNQTSTKDALTHTTQYGYDTYSNLTARQDALNRTTQYTYDELNRQKQSTTPLGKAAKWEYDANGNITKRIDESNRATSYEYDPMNRLKKTIYPDTSVVTYAYDDRGNLTQTTTPTGNSSYQYDAYDRLVSETDPYNEAIQYTYDAADNVTQVKYPDNKTVQYAYDSVDRLQSVTDWNSQQTSYQYYSNGLLASKQLPNGIKAAYTYDASNRLSVLEYTKNQQPVTKYAYQRNATGNITKEIEESGSAPSAAPPTTYMIYDEQLRTGWSDGWSWDSTTNLNATGNAQTGTKSISWQPNGAWGGLHLRIAAGSFDTSPYNAISFAAQAAQAGQRAMMSMKDTNDNDLAQVDLSLYGGDVKPDGYTVYNIPLAALNADNRQVLGLSITDGSGGAQPAFYIDNIQFTTAKGNDVGIYENNLKQGIENWSWGTNNYLDDPSDPYRDAKAITTTYNDAWGALALHNWNGFSTKGYTHLSLAVKSNTNNQPLSIQFSDQLGAGKGNELNLDAYGGYPNSADYKIYNIPLQDLGVTNQKVHGIRLQEEAGTVPRIIKVDDIKLTAQNPANPPQETNYTYDALGRLLTANYPGRSYSYTYDAVGNRLTSNENGTPSTYTYNNDNQLTTKGSRTFAYDNQGNQTGDGSKTLSFNFDNKLTAWNDPLSSTALAYAYDGAGHRIQKTANGTTHQYVNSTAGNLSQVLVDKNTSANTQNFYAYGDSLLSQGNAPGSQRQYFITDATGNTRYLTDASGQVLQSYAYDPYGTQASAGNATDRSFQTEKLDRESNLTYLRARYYDSSTGRFISRDPVAGSKTTPQSQNGYSYAHNDPINLIDPTGMSAWTTFQRFTGLDKYQNALANPSCGASTIASTGAQATGKLAVLGAGVVATGLGAEYLITGSVAVPFANRAAELGSTNSNITFQTGHASRHLAGTNLLSTEVEAAIRNDLAYNMQAVRTDQSVSLQTSIDKYLVEYRAMSLPDGNVSVGTYYIK